VPGQPSVHTPPSGARGNGKLYPQIGNQPLGIFDRQLNAKRTLFSSQNEDNDPFVELMMSCLLVLKSMNFLSSRSLCQRFLRSARLNSYSVGLVNAWLSMPGDAFHRCACGVPRAISIGIGRQPGAAYRTRAKVAELAASD